MVVEKELYKDNWGTDIIMDTKVSSLENISAILVTCKRPDGSRFTEVGYVVEGSNSLIYYRTQEGDVISVGEYKFWLTTEWVDGSRHLDSVPFTRVAKVNPNDA